jgi:MFS family permease
VLLPIFADAVFHRGAAGLGWLMTAVGVGALSGALFLAGRKGLAGIGRIISYSSFGFGAFLFFFSVSNLFWLSFALLAFVGFFMMLTIASINTTIQSIIPDELRGRVMSFFTTMLIGTAPIGSLLSGAVAKYAGVRITVFLSAVVCLCAAYWFHHWLPKIRPEARRLYLLQNPTVGGSLP